METIPYGMLVASRLQAQRQPNDRGHTTRNRLAIIFAILEGALQFSLAVDFVRLLAIIQNNKSMPTGHSNPVI